MQANSELNIQTYLKLFFRSTHMTVGRILTFLHVRRWWPNTGTKNISQDLSCFLIRYQQSHYYQCLETCRFPFCQQHGRLASNQYLHQIRQYHFSPDSLPRVSSGSPSLVYWLIFMLKHTSDQFPVCLRTCKQPVTLSLISWPFPCLQLFFLLNPGSLKPLSFVHTVFCYILPFNLPKKQSCIYNVCPESYFHYGVYWFPFQCLTVQTFIMRCRYLYNLDIFSPSLSPESRYIFMHVTQCLVHGRG